MEFVYEKVKNNLDKGENICNHFLPFLLNFQKPLWSGSFKFVILWQKVEAWNYDITLYSTVPTFNALPDDKF